MSSIINPLDNYNIVILVVSDLDACDLDLRSISINRGSTDRDRSRSIKDQLKSYRCLIPFQIKLFIIYV